MRPIDADALKELEEIDYTYFAARPGVPYYEADQVWAIIDNAPTIDPESLRPQGVWECEYETWGKMQCSVCKKEALLEESEGDIRKTLLYVTSNYCPNCGAKMKGEEK